MPQTRSLLLWKLALLTMLFGFGSGMVRNIHQGTVNWYMIKQYLIPAVPGAVIGSLLTSHVIGTAVAIMFIVNIVAALTRMNLLFVSGLIENRTTLIIDLDICQYPDIFQIAGIKRIKNQQYL